MPQDLISSKPMAIDTVSTNSVSGGSSQDALARSTGNDLSNDLGVVVLSIPRPATPTSEDWELDFRLRNFAPRRLSAGDTGIPTPRRPLPPPPPGLLVPDVDARNKFVQLCVMSNNGNSFPALDGPMNNSRQGASPTSSHSSQVNGNGISNANYMAPLPVGHQQDLNFLYSQLQELGGILRSNRDKVNTITKTAEEFAKRANGTQVNGEGDKEADAARIRDIEHQLAKANHMVSLYKHEQTENTKLIAEYEDALGTATEQIRYYCSDMNERFIAQRRHYNNLLQQEKDEHLQSRLDRDAWHAKTARVCEMIRTAYRLRCEESNEELEVVSALQAEVRIYRKCLGMEREKPEEETGWPYLKDAPLNIEGCDES